MRGNAQFTGPSLCGHFCTAAIILNRREKSQLQTNVPNTVVSVK